MHRLVVGNGGVVFTQETSGHFRGTTQPPQQPRNLISKGELEASGSNEGSGRKGDVSKVLLGQDPQELLGREMLVHVTLPLRCHGRHLVVQFRTATPLHGVGAFIEATLAGHFQALFFVARTGTAPSLKFLQPSSQHLHSFCPGPKQSVSNGRLHITSLRSVPDVVVSCLVVLLKDPMDREEVATDLVEGARCQTSIWRSWR